MGCYEDGFLGMVGGRVGSYEGGLEVRWVVGRMGPRVS